MAPESGKPRKRSLSSSLNSAGIVPAGVAQMDDIKGTRDLPPAYQVLLIEEDPKETELYADLIREVGNCRVDVVSRLENSYEWISRSNYNLVVVDSSLRPALAGRRRQEIDGLAILEQIKRMSPVTGVILISEQATVERAVSAIRLGAEDYLKKPFNLESFQLAVKRGLDRKAVFGGEAGVSDFFNLLNSCQMISAALEPEKIFGIVASYLRRALNCEHAAIYSLAPGEDKEIGHRLSESLGERIPEHAHHDRAIEEILDIALQAANPIPRMIASGEWCRFVDRGQLTPGLFVFRFRCAGPNEYFCVCISPERPAVLESFESRLRMLKIQIEVTGKNIEEFLGVQSLVYVDDATGLYNTRYLNFILDREIANSQSTGRPFAVLFMDADRFKSINDKHGHLVGTKILNELGDQLKRFVRDKDTVFRYGGDEFVAVLSNADLATAQAVAERIRASVEKRVFLECEGLSLRFTVSIGIAIFPENASSKKEIIDAADHAMYDAKKRTRNSVSIAQGFKPESTPPSPEGSFRLNAYRLVVSDFHLGKGRYLGDGTQNILEDFIFDREFSEFLAFHRTGKFADATVELVLNGDILNLLQIDTWGVHTHMVTERAMVRAVEKIVAGHAEFFLALRRFAATPGHTIAYVVGNHDMGMLWSGPRRVFEEAVGASVAWSDVYYLKDGIYIEHGQQYESFSATDMQKPFISRGLPEPVLNLPWASLFVAIVLPWVKQQRPHVDKVRPFHHFLKWVAIHDLWWGIKIGLSVLKFMFDTVLFHRRYQIQNGVGHTISMLKEITLYPNFDKIAFRILEERDDVSVVIFGHTHLIRYRRWREGKEYFNEGTWNDNTSLELEDYGKSIRLTYAFIEYLPDSVRPQRPVVRLKQWFGEWRPEADLII